MNDFLELCKNRRSVRSFDGKLPDSNILDELKSFASKIANPYGVKVRFVFLDAKEHDLSSPVLSGDRYYVTAVVDKVEHSDEAFGYSFEKLLMHAHELGLGTVWIGGTMPRDKFEKASDLADGEIMPCVSPLGITAGKMSVKEILMRKGVKADSRLPFDKLFFTGDFSTPLTEDRAKELGIYKALEAVRLAPSAVNKQPWRVIADDHKAVFYVKHDKGFSTPSYDLQVIDLGIAMYHFEAQMATEGVTPLLTRYDHHPQAPSGMDYIATYSY
ncbi:nitroreductase family protein [Butyrivibrio sp. MC2013]|uniref:nitroreductase family protein n=1 Tax=Butyrivibrio sp. MC2013 TaxID=1280686 RepID=UPI0003F5334F|nr:nitroreductase family protein [Butyrivibrio sp. MC2013]